MSKVLTVALNNFSTDHHPLVRSHLFVALVVALSAFNTLSAQTAGKISGTILDAESGEALIGCNVLVEGTRLGAVSDPDGSFFILNIPPGKYDIQASILGYQKVVQRDVIVNSDKTTTLSFRLTSAALVQGVVEVVAVRPDVEPEKTSTSAIIRADDVRQVAGMRDVTDVIGLAADVTDGHFRGGRSGEELYTLQGMGIINPLDASTAFVPIMSAVEEVEVITSGFGAQYGNAQSGVVNISMKEGKSDKWRSSIETRLRMPGRKHFGPSVFDPNGNPYLATLLNESNWLLGDPNNSNQPYYVGISNTKDGYARDTSVQLKVATTLWRMQMKRDIGRNYGNTLDYSVEGGTGGPLNENMRMFIALRSNVSNPEFPTERPDLQQQFMGNIATDLGKASTLIVSGGYARNFSNVFPSSNGLGFYNWLWDRSLDIQYQQTVNTQFGARFTKALSPKTFYELKLNGLQTHMNFGSRPWASVVPESLYGVPINGHGTVITKPVTGPDEFGYLDGTDDFRDEKTTTISLEAALTSQQTKYHLLNAGLQVNLYTIDANDDLNTSATLQTRKYSAKPFEAGLYLQDKMEFEGMIANIGLRWDLWSVDKEYYTNLFNPFGVLDSLGRPTNIVDPNAAPKAKPPILGRLQPRTGISFPVNLSTVFHLNYGSFMQRPSFQYIVATTVQPGTRFATPITLGNPRLEPQTTNSYDLGVAIGLGEGFTVDISGYYKDVKNLIEQATFTGGGVTYNSYFNRDYADIRGFRVSLSKRQGEFIGSINYQFGYATGKSATVSNAPPLFRQTIDSVTQTPIVTTELDNVPRRDILLDFDRTHNLVVTLAYITDNAWGPELFDSYPLSDIAFSVNAFARSGRPYTSSTDTKLINGARTPAEYNTNIRVSKKIRGVFGTDATLYGEVINLFNDKILNYTYLFSTPNAGQTNSRVESYENYPLNDPTRGVLYWNDTNFGRSFAVDQSFLIYDNTPRSYFIGLAVDF